MSKKSLNSVSTKPSYLRSQTFYAKILRYQNILHYYKNQSNRVKTALIRKKKGILKKIQKAYAALLQGRKYEETFTEKQKNFLRLNNANCIRFQSQKNIKWLERELSNFQDQSQFSECTKENEQALFKALISLPWRCQHATDVPSKILKRRQLMSFKELQRHNRKFKSLYTTDRNKKGLGNTDFVFFRVFVEGANGDETRYGHAKFITNLNLLLENGWVSLHDQESPFGEKPYSKTKSTIIFRKGTVSDGGTTLNYDYYDVSGKLIVNSTRSHSFLNEIFYGPDIIIGIARAFILELRYINRYNSQLVTQFYNDFSIARETNKITELLGPWVREFFHIEGKLPVRMNIVTEQRMRLSCSDIMARPNKRQQVTLTKESTELTEQQWKQLRALEKICETQRNAKQTLTLFNRYYQSLIELIPLQVKRRKRDLVGKCAKDYLRLVPGTKNIVCANGQPLEDGLTVLLLGSLIQLEVPMHTIPKKREAVPTVILKLEFLLSSEYFNWLRNRIVSYLEIKILDLDKLQIIDDLYGKHITNRDITFSEIASLTPGEFIAIQKYEVREILEAIEALENQLLTFCEFAKYADINPPFAFLLQTRCLDLAELNLDIDQLYNLYEENESTLEYLADDDIEELIRDLAPDIPPKLAEYLQENYSSLAEIVDDLDEDAKEKVANTLGLDVLEASSDDPEAQIIEAYSNPFVLFRAALSGGTEDMSDEIEDAIAYSNLQKKRHRNDDDDNEDDDDHISEDDNTSSEQDDDDTQDSDNESDYDHSSDDDNNDDDNDLSNEQIHSENESARLQHAQHPSQTDFFNPKKRQRDDDDDDDDYKVEQLAKQAKQTVMQSK